MYCVSSKQQCAVKASLIGIVLIASLARSAADTKGVASENHMRKRTTSRILSSQFPVGNYLRCQICGRQQGR